jgi:glycosyltransferase involved in cell wall biosynthesis
MSIDDTFTFGGAIISLYHMCRGFDKSIISPVVVSGQPLDYLEEKFPDCACYHLIPKLNWIDNRKYLKLKGLWPVRQSTFLLKCLNLARFCYWLLFVTFPESLKYYRIGRRYRIDLVHLNNGHLQLSALLAAKILRVPCVSHLRGFASDNTFNRFIARFIDHHVAISHAIRDNLLQLGVPVERITLVHDAIDLDEFNSEVDSTYLIEEFGLTPEQPVYGLFGRIVPWKGIKEFILMAQRVNEKVPEARGVIVGDASDGDIAFFDEMRRLVTELGLDGKIIFTGYRQDIPALMGLMDVVVHASSKPEPFGMVIIEGMALNKPIVATCAGGPLDIVMDGQTGYLVEIENDEALGEAVIKLLLDPALCRSMGEKGRARAEEFFTHRLYARKMAKIFMHLTNGCQESEDITHTVRSSL